MQQKEKGEKILIDLYRLLKNFFIRGKILLEYA